MNKRKAIWILIFITVFTWVSKAQEQVHLLPDRTSCVSGDTVWFNAIIFNNLADNTGNVVHLQLDNLSQKHITSVSVVCSGNRAEGYLAVPDSLSTGVYVLKAYTNFQKSEQNVIIRQKYLTVYNRFESVVNLISVPEQAKTNFESITGLAIKAQSAGADQVNLELDLPSEFKENATQVIVTARLADPLADPLASGWTDSEINQEEEPYMAVKENNGVVVTGRVYSKSSGLPKVKSTVMLSISDTLPYFDYCISDEEGRFFFYIRNAFGTADLVFQELTEDPNDTGIELFDNYVTTVSSSGEEKILSAEQRTFATDVIKATYYDKFFNRGRGLSVDSFLMIKDFKYPFYGEPTKSYFPELFVDLESFEEISREILRGVQYRERKGEVSIRMLDYGTQTQFKDEPFKLLDGIPLLDPASLSSMGTTKIKKVDAVYYKRYFGDLFFNGVLALYSNNPTLGWVETATGMSLIPYEFLQAPLNWNFASSNSRYTNIPDFNKVLLRQAFTGSAGIKQFNFDMPDIKGDLIVEVIAVTSENKILKSSKLIRIDEILSGK